MLKLDSLRVTVDTPKWYQMLTAWRRTHAKHAPLGYCLAGKPGWQWWQMAAVTWPHSFSLQHCTALYHTAQQWSRDTEL